jgi:death-on-curing protein
MPWNQQSINQPRLTFNQTDLYPDIITKAAALCFFLIMNHPFVDGNKRIGHAAMETFLILNGFEIEATFDDQKKSSLIFQREISTGNNLLFGLIIISFI